MSMRVGKGEPDRKRLSFSSPGSRFKSVSRDYRSPLAFVEAGELNLRVDLSE